MERRRFLIGLGALSSGCVSSFMSLAAPDVAGKVQNTGRRAVSIGIDSYDNRQFNLNAASDDALKISRTIGKIWDEPAYQMLNPKKKDLENILFGGYLSAKFNILYYAGHAAYSDGDLYMFPSDFRLDSKGVDADSLISLKDVVARFPESGNSVVIIDACRSASKFSFNRRRTAKANLRGNTIVIYSAPLGQKANDYGYFASRFSAVMELPGITIEGAIFAAGEFSSKDCTLRESIASEGGVDKNLMFTGEINIKAPRNRKTLENSVESFCHDSSDHSESIGIDVSLAELEERILDDTVRSELRGDRLLLGRGVTKNVDGALAEYQRAAKFGSLYGRMMVGFVLDRYVGHGEYQEDVELSYLEAANSNYIEAAHNLALYYRRNGNIDGCVKYLKIASDHGFSESTNGIADIYIDALRESGVKFENNGVVTLLRGEWLDEQEIISRLILSGKTGGDGRSYEYLGLLIVEILQRDLRGATSRDKKKVESRARGKLGEAVRYFELSSRYGNTRSACHLAWVYGILRDKSRQQKWLDEAGRNGWSSDCKRL